MWLLFDCLMRLAAHLDVSSRIGMQPNALDDLILRPQKPHREQDELRLKFLKAIFCEFTIIQPPSIKTWFTTVLFRDVAVEVDTSAERGGSAIWDLD